MSKQSAPNSPRVSAAAACASDFHVELATVRLALLAGATGIGFYLIYRLALPFLSAFTWALMLAVILAPVHRHVATRVGRPGFATLLTSAGAAIIVATPLALVVQQLLREAAAGAATLERLVATLDWRETLEGMTWLLAAADWAEQRFEAAGLLETLAEWLTRSGGNLFRGSVHETIGIVLAFYILFYLLRDRRQGLATLVAYSPLRSAETMRVVRRFSETVRASLFGFVTVGVIQGTLGGLMFWWLDLPTPVFWGLLMGLLAIIPMLGAFVVWVPAAIILALSSEWLSAVLLAAWGGLIIATIDNLLYPMLVGNRLRLHTLVAFVGAVGGILLFGATGIVLGPAIVAVTLELVAILRQRAGRKRPAP
ncbi:MAG: AI-2E family transporter [Rhizobiaceae bacterium]|nr:AI-2E family transporter [Rhizobiaceae bacterium]